MRRLFLLTAIVLSLTGITVGAKSLDDDWLRLKVGSSRRIPKQFASAEVKDTTIAEIRRDRLAECLRVHALKPGETTLSLTYLEQPRTIEIRVVVKSVGQLRKKKRGDAGMKIGGWAK